MSIVGKFCRVFGKIRLADRRTLSRMGMRTMSSRTAFAARYSTAASCAASRSFCCVSRAFSGALGLGGRFVLEVDPACASSGRANMPQALVSNIVVSKESGQQPLSLLCVAQYDIGTPFIGQEPSHLG